MPALWKRNSGRVELKTTPLIEYGLSLTKKSGMDSINYLTACRQFAVLNLHG